MSARKFLVLVENRRRPWWKTVARYVGSNVGLCLVCFGFALLGAEIFIRIELPTEESQRLLKLEKTREIEESIDYLKKQFWIYSNNDNRYGLTIHGYKNTVKTDLEMLKVLVTRYVHDYSFDGTTDWNYSWTLPNSLLFVLTIMTTIGYGNITPQTNVGKMFTIIFALAGIPLLLVLMTKIGDFLADSLKASYRNLCCRWCRRRRIKTEREELEEMIGTHTSGVTKPYMQEIEVEIPIMISLLIVILFLFVGAIIFSNWEDWQLGSSLYFCFITLTTVGFGDLVPTESLLNYNDGVWPFIKMMIALFYIIFGIALLSMCIQLIQDVLISKVSSMAKKLGMKSNEANQIEA